MPEPDLDAIRRRVAAATPGPWSRHGADIRAGDDGAVLFTGRDGSAEVRQQADRDAEFVAHARADVLALLDRLAQLTEAAEPVPSG
jgi:hypothetical protein